MVQSYHEWTVGAKLLNIISATVFKANMTALG